MAFSIETDDELFNRILILLTRFIKVGEVSSVNYAAGTARVVFDDEDAIVSYDLPVLQRNTIKNRDYEMPDIGEDVVCIFLPTGSEEGFIIGSFYADEITPPESDGNKRTVIFSDDTRISYDRVTHELSITIAGTTTIIADAKSVSVDTPQAVNIKSGSAVTVEGAAQINLTSQVVNITVGGTTMSLNGSNATIESDTLTLNGTMNITGNINVKGSANFDGGVSATGAIHGSNI